MPLYQPTSAIYHPQAGTRGSDACTADPQAQPPSGRDAPCALQLLREAYYTCGAGGQLSLSLSLSLTLTLTLELLREAYHTCGTGG